MDSTQIIAALAGAVSTIAGLLYTSMQGDRNYWRSRAESLEAEARKAADEQARENAEWRRKAYETRGEAPR